MQIYTNKPKQTELSKLVVGDVFKYQNNIWLKLQGSHEYVNLTTNTFRILSATTKVQKIEAYIKIRE